jgi:hypothetical protein
MKEKHIINLLEEAPFASLSESEHLEIQTHTANCSDCAQAYQAARVSAALLLENAAVAFEPSPFFHTKVLAALRERQSETPAYKRLWQTAGALVSSMTATVALLAVLSFLVPGTQSLSTAQASPSNGYSAEEVILNQNDLAEEQASDAQVLTNLYDGDENAAR